MAKTEYYFYLCDGSAPCKYRADGKENEYCRRNPAGVTGCYHTSKLEFAKNKNPKNFEDKKAYGVILHIERDSDD